jgi:hypothetical protein
VRLIDSSLGKSIRSRRLVCFGLQATPQRRSAGRPWRPPLHGMLSPRITVRVFDRAGEALLHVGTEAVVGGKSGNLGPSRRPLGLPLRGRPAVLQLAATRGSVAPQISRNRRRTTAQTAGDLVPARSLSFRIAISSRSANNR